MRLVNWNCNEGFGTKYPLVRNFGFDVAVITECGPFSASLEQDRALTQVMRVATGMPTHTKHIGVLAQDPWSVEELEPIADQPWILPVRISGPTDFTLFAIWTLGPEYVNNLSYVDQLEMTIKESLAKVKGPSVIAGNFNAPVNPMRDGSSADKIRKHHGNVDALKKLGLVSAFTSARGIKVDPLSEPTYFHMWKKTNPYHLDHVFLPKSWTRGIDIKIGTFEAWVSKSISDHTPMIVDIRPSEVFKDGSPAGEAVAVPEVDAAAEEAGRSSASKQKVPRSRAAFDANLQDAQKLVDVVRIFENQRQMRMRSEMRERVGEALKVPAKKRDELDWITNDDVSIIFSPDTSYSRSDFSGEELAPLLRQAVVAACAAVETFVADRAKERLSKIDRSDPPKRLKEIPTTVGDWLELEAKFTRPGHGLRTVVHETIEQRASSAPSSIGQLMSMVGVGNLWGQIDTHRSVPAGRSEIAMEAITLRRNRIAHTLDRRGRGHNREQITVAETEEILTTIIRIVDALDFVTRV